MRTYLGELFGKSSPKPLQKLFIREWDEYSLCRSGASNMVGTNSEKIARDLVTSAQWDVGFGFLGIIFLRGGRVGLFLCSAKLNLEFDFSHKM